MWPWWDGTMTHHRIQLPGAKVIIKSKEQEPLIAGLMGDMVQMQVLEPKEKQRPGRTVYLVLYEWMEVKRKGAMVKAREVAAGDVVWWGGEPFKVVWIKPWEKTKHDEN